ncbi:MAG: DNA-formamidopyrimidine glycosylase family protein [Candidatus Thermoplasmatota archaeon]
MPELPDVEVFKKYLDSTSLQKNIEKVEVENPKILEDITVEELKNKIEGKKFKKSRRHGKYLFVEINDNNWLILHFGMTGELKFYKEKSEQPDHARIIFHFDNGYRLAFDCQRLLGIVSLTDSVDDFIEKKQLGVDALDINQKDFLELLNNRRGTIKSALMNQKIVAGVGNIYSDEILFQTDLHPKSKVKNIDEKTLSKIYSSMKEVMKVAIDNNVNPEEFPENYLLLYRDVGNKCPKDDGEIQRVKVSGRSAYYCPKHQKKI